MQHDFIAHGTPVSSEGASLNTALTNLPNAHNLLRKSTSCLSKPQHTYTKVVMTLHVQLRTDPLKLHTSKATETLEVLNQ